MNFISNILLFITSILYNVYSVVQNIFHIIILGFSYILFPYIFYTSFSTALHDAPFKKRIYL